MYSLCCSCAVICYVIGNFMLFCPLFSRNLPPSWRFLFHLWFPYLVVFHFYFHRIYIIAELRTQYPIVINRKMQGLKYVQTLDFSLIHPKNSYAKKSTHWLNLDVGLHQLCIYINNFYSCFLYSVFYFSLLSGFCCFLIILQPIKFQSGLIHKFKQCSLFYRNCCIELIASVVYLR